MEVSNEVQLGPSTSVIFGPAAAAFVLCELASTTSLFIFNNYTRSDINVTMSECLRVVVTLASCLVSAGSEADFM